MNQDIITLDFTEHALKRLDILIGEEKAQKELRFLHNFILPGTYTIPWYCGIHLKDVELFAKRCEQFNIRFLGMEVHIDGPYPLFVHCWEDYPAHGPDWYRLAVADLQFHEVCDHLIPTVNIPKDVLDRYLI